MKPKLPHEISVEELLKSLEGQDLVNDKTVFSYENPILSFIQTFKISSGKHTVSDKVLHDLFRFWNTTIVLDQRSFNIQLGKYIPSVLRNRRYYLVDKKVLELAQKVEELKKKHSSDRSRSIKWNKHFEKFLSDTEIEEGTLFIEVDILYYAYRRWCDDTRKKSWLSQESFANICKLNFNTKRISDSKLAWFGVNHKIKELITREEVERWREGRKQRGKEINKKDYRGASPRIKYRKEVLYPKKIKKK